MTTAWQLNPELSSTSYSTKAVSLSCWFAIVITVVRGPEIVVFGAFEDVRIGGGNASKDGLKANKNTLCAKRCTAYGQHEPILQLHEWVYRE